MASESNCDIWTPRANAVAQAFIDDLLKEKANLSDDFPILNMVIEDTIDRIYSCGRIPGRDFPADVFKQRPIKLAQNVYLPTKQYPHFNFKGKILGPKGNTLKRLHTETMCNISIKGRTSMRDEAREEELRSSGDPVFNHLNKNLHVEITTVAPPAEAYARMAYALSEIRKYIIPDKNDEISQEQYREYLKLHPERAKKAPVQKSVFDKLRKLKSGNDEPEEDEEDDEDDKPISPPKKKATQSSAGNKVATPVFAGKINTRTKPYQKKIPFKK